MTPQIHLHVLASGSKGNAAVVEGPEGSVLVDDGIARRTLLARASELGVNMDDVRAVLLTHEHTDHIAGLPVFANHFDGPLFATAGTIAARERLSQLPFEVIGHTDALELCGMHVTVFPTSHDVADPVGFRFSTTDENGELTDALGCCTDTGILTDEAGQALSGCRVLALESNHDERMLAAGPYPGYLKQRIHGRHGHLSNAQAADALADLVTNETEVIVGMHLSQENNRPSVAVRALAAAVEAEATNETFTEARTPDGHLTVCASAQDAPLTVW
ncbi:MAG: MBL fold metallo-hydrolase [Olsenella sp.]|nr:MBL fold metallo-hydrolase [Olsenella sp.]